MKRDKYLLLATKFLSAGIEEQKRYVWVYIPLFTVCIARYTIYMCFMLLKFVPARNFGSLCICSGIGGCDDLFYYYK